MLLPSAKLVKKVRSFAEELEPLAPHIDLKDLFRIFVNLGSARIASPLRDCLARLIFCRVPKDKDEEKQMKDAVKTFLGEAKPKAPKLEYALNRPTTKNVPAAQEALEMAVEILWTSKKTMKQAALDVSLRVILDDDFAMCDSIEGCVLALICLILSLVLGHDCHSTVGGGFSDILTKMSWFHRRKEDLSDFFEYPEHVNRRLPKDVKLIMIEHAEFYCKRFDLDTDTFWLMVTAPRSKGWTGPPEMRTIAALTYVECVRQQPLYFWSGFTVFSGEILPRKESRNGTTGRGAGARSQTNTKEILEFARIRYHHPTATIFQIHNILEPWRVQQEQPSRTLSATEGMARRHALNIQEAVDAYTEATAGEAPMLRDEISREDTYRPPPRRERYQKRLAEGAARGTPELDFAEDTATEADGNDSDLPGPSTPVANSSKAFARLATSTNPAQQAASTKRKAATSSAPRKEDDTQASRNGSGSGGPGIRPRFTKAKSKSSGKKRQRANDDVDEEGNLLGFAVPDNVPIKKLRKQQVLAESEELAPRAARESGRTVNPALAEYKKAREEKAAKAASKSG